jgi:AcrR family transcriptional regulator
MLPNNRLLGEREMATAATVSVGRQAGRQSRRQDNRRPQLLDAAARRFRAFGYDATSMRDIAGDVGMHAGSMYYHFPSKEDLLVAVHEEGIRRISAAVETAIVAEHEPWRRLEAFAAAHLGVLLDGGDYAQVVIRELPREPEQVRCGLVRLRDRYERLAAGLVEALPLSTGVDRRALRLLLMGALNWSQTWYRPGGEPPQAIAATFVALLRQGLEPGEAEA